MKGRPKVNADRRIDCVSGLRATAAALLLFVLAGCGKVPTWNELTGGQPQQPAQTAPAPVQPAPTPSTVQAPPAKPNAAEVVAAFKQLRPSEISDAHLDQLASLSDGLESVNEIALSGSSVTNSGLASVSKLPALKQLDLTGTRIDDGGMQHLTQAPALETLVLSGTKVSDEGVSILKGCPQLKKLELVGCQLTPVGFAAVGQLPALEEINLDSTSGINDATFDLICNAKTLKRLHMSYVGGISDRGLQALSKLEVLEELWISESPVTGEGLTNVAKSGLKHLKKLAMNRCPITLAGARAINSCKSLEYLNVAGLGMDDKGFVILVTGLKNLKHLHIASCKNLTGSGFTALKPADDLEILVLQSCGIVDQALPLLKGHKNLKKLDVTGTSVTGGAAAAFKKLLPECEILCDSGRL